MTSLLFVTIDSSSTLDIDDAISISQRGDDFVVTVAIADPTNLVDAGSEVDLLALERAATIYSRDRAVQPMLPRHISTERGSLIAGTDRQALVFKMILNSSLDVIEFEPASQVIRVSERLTYEAIPDIIQGPPGALRDMLTLFSRVCTLLLQSRRAKGALALFDLSKLMLSDEEGNLRQFESQDQMIGHIIVQEMMILANAQIALFMAEKGIPAIYRNHKCRVSAPTALDLANTVDQWIKTGVATQDGVAVQINTLVERAVYDSVAHGHYGLCLPLYLHGTSPLRRYADLVNARQLRAHIDGEKLPYDQAALLDIAKSLTATLRDRSEATVEYHKDALAKKAQRLIDSGNLAQMEDNVLSASVKLAIGAGYLPVPVIDELIRRLDNRSIADAIVDRLAIQIPRKAITPELGEAFSRWMHSTPPSVVRVLMNGIQTNVFENLVVKEVPSKVGFKVIASVTCIANGERYEGVGLDAKKRTAEQKAIVEILCRYLDLPMQSLGCTDQAPSAPTATPLVKNHKGALLEHCQKNGWPSPDFQVQVSGPSNGASFVATVTLRLKDERTYTATSSVMATKKDSEASAAAALMEKIHSSPKVKPVIQPSTAAVGNPVGFLQELAQKRKLAAPQYEYVQLGTAPHSFECELTMQIGGAVLSAKAVASSKKTAKELSAVALLEKVKADFLE